MTEEDLTPRGDGNGHPAELFEAALRTGGLGTWQTDLVAGTRTWTATAVEIFGIDVPLDMPIPFDERDHLREVLHPEDSGMLEDAHAQLAESDEIEVGYRIVHPTLGVRHLAGRGRVLARDAENRPVRVVHIVADVTLRHEIETQNAMLMRELTHRTKNQLAVVLAMARRIGRDAPSFDAFLEAFAQRIEGMAAGIDTLVEPEWRTMPIRALITSQLRGFLPPGSRRLVLMGAPLEIDAGAGQALGMAIHELAANAIQHGALSNAGGRIEIAWQVDRSQDGPAMLRLEWEERDGPPVGPPGRAGFGSMVLKSMIASALDARVTYEFRDQGAYWGIEAPIAKSGAGDQRTGIFAEIGRY